MTAQDLVETLRRAGIELVVCGDRLRVEAPRGTVTPEVLAQLQEHKAMVIAELARRACWPSESLVAQRNFGVPEARLYPFLNKRVETPAGPGQLLQVFSERVAIRLDTQDSEIAYFRLSSTMSGSFRGPLASSRAGLGGRGRKRAWRVAEVVSR